GDDNRNFDAQDVHHLHMGERDNAGWHYPLRRRVTAADTLLWVMNEFKDAVDNERREAFTQTYRQNNACIPPGDTIELI
ncbi:MAG: hypothetical protein KKI08_06955, partial [Armatimonadetes bacterium]|nr:hypothetical protein [Armatimonadota bacterium]